MEFGIPLLFVASCVGAWGELSLLPLRSLPFSFSRPLVSTLLVLGPNLISILLYGYSGTFPTVIFHVTHSSGRISS